MNELKNYGIRINELRKMIKEAHPLVHCITNPISINQCANTILATGARPICAEHPEEAAEVTATAKAVMLNIGNITDARRESIRISAKEADRLGIGFVIDICGAACLKSRRSFAEQIISIYAPSVVKGNYSEIKAIYDMEYKSTGIDADSGLGLDEADEAAFELARMYQTTVMASGEVDIVTDGHKLFHIYNGSPQLSTVTGTGCMQGALCAAFLTAAESIDAAVASAAMLGICGELAETEKGSGTFMVNLLDRLSTITDDEVITKLKISTTSSRNESGGIS